MTDTLPVPEIASRGVNISFWMPLDQAKEFFDYCAERRSCRSVVIRDAIAAEVEEARQNKIDERYAPSNKKKHRLADH